MIKYKILLLLIILTCVYLYVGKNFHIYIPKNSCNYLCQKDKYNKVKEKGYFSDKIKIKEYLSENFPHINYAKLLYQTDDPKSLKNISLPEDFVLKNSSGSRMFQIVKDGKYNINKLIKKSKKFLSITHGEYGYRKIPFLNLKEPHYKYNQRKILIEEYIPNTEEFRIMMVKGEILYYEWFRKVSGEGYVIYRANDTEIYRLDKEWKKLDVCYGDEEKKNIPIEKPKYFEKINQFCYDFFEKNDFNLMRIDLLLNETDFYFGEITFTPRNCRYPYLDSFDKKFEHLFA